MSYKTLKRLLLWERKQTKVGCQLPTATKMAELGEEEPVPTLLLPCATCGRTFRPETLAKHVKVCEKSLMRKRKQFDSAKQRIQGTDLAQFVPTEKTPKKREPVTRKESLTRWKEKQSETLRSVKSTKLICEEEGAQTSRAPGHEQCPYCDRYFGPKAFDRHTDWCKEQQCRVISKTQACLEAKERLEARTKYRAPLNKTQRTLTKEKYSPVRHTRDPSPLINRSLMSTSLTHRLTESHKDIIHAASTPSLTRSTPQRSSFRHTTAAKIPAIAPRGLTRSNSMRASSKTDRGSTSSLFESAGDTTPTKSQITLNNKPKLFGKPNTSEKRTSFPHVVRHIITTVLPKRLKVDDLEKYDPYISAKLQMLDLYSNDGDKGQSNGDNVSSPDSASSASDTPNTPLTIRSSPPSAFAKFLPISPEKPSPVLATSTIGKQISPNNNENNNNINNNNINNNNNNNRLIQRKDSPEGEKVDNRRNISLSSLSLCSVISLDSADYNRSPVNWKQSRDFRTRSNSALDSSSMFIGRNTARSRLNTQQSLGYSPQSTPSPAATVVLDNKSKDDLETCEAELLISMMEFEKMLNLSPTHSLQSSPALCSSSFPSEYEGSSGVGDDKHFGVNAEDISRKPSVNLQCSDSAYSSLTRKTPVDGLENTVVASKTDFTQPKFCHECGAKYPVAEAKFCCQCGVRRLTI